MEYCGLTEQEHHGESFRKNKVSGKLYMLDLQNGQKLEYLKNIQRVECRRR